MSLTPSDFQFGMPVSLSAQPLDMIYGTQDRLNSSINSLPGLAPSAPASTGMGPMGIANGVLSGLQTLGQLWGAFQSIKLAKKQFNFAKDYTNTNLANQIQSYNTALADRARSRGFMESQTPDQVSGYISANALNRNSGRDGGSPLSAITAASLANYRLPTQPTKPTETPGY